ALWESALLANLVLRQVVRGQRPLLRRIEPGGMGYGVTSSRAVSAGFALQNSQFRFGARCLAADRRLGQRGFTRFNDEAMRQGIPALGLPAVGRGIAFVQYVLADQGLGHAELHVGVQVWVVMRIHL